MNTTSFSGDDAAALTASSMEYTIRTSLPSALASFSEPIVVGTFIMSPNTHTVFPDLANVMPAATSPLVVTHTGQPGP
jgi:hypothetical protein